MYNENDHDEDEEETVERKPLCTFTKSQTLLVAGDGWLREYKISGDEKKTKDPFRFVYQFGTVYGYILNRNKDFEHRFYGWALDR